MLQPIIQIYPEEALAGGLARSLTVPEGAVALVQKDGQAELLPPGQHQVRSLWGGLIGQPLPAIWQVQTGPITLHPIFANLLDAEDQLIFMDMLVAAQVEDPERLWQALNPGYEPLTKPDLERLLAEQLAGRIRTLVKKYPLPSLINLPEAQEAVNRGFIQSLRAVLAEWGMTLQGVTHLGFQKANDAVTIERQAQEIRRALDDIALQTEIDRMENEAVLEHARADFGLTDADVAELQETVIAAPEESALKTFLLEKLTRIEESVNQRLEKLAKEEDDIKKDVESKGEFPGHKNLQRLVMILRILSYVIAATIAASALFHNLFPSLDHYNNHLHLVGALVGLVLALAAIASSWFVDRHIVNAQAKALVQAEQESKALDRAKLVARERGIRRYFEKRLRQVAGNCEEAWKRVYNRDIDLAGAMRRYCVKPYNALADEVRAAEFATARFFQQDEIDVENLARLLDLSENLLNDAEEMVRLSQDAYRAAADGDAADVKVVLDMLDQGRMALKNRFAEREQFLMS